MKNSTSAAGSRRALPIALYASAPPRLCANNSLLLAYPTSLPLGQRIGHHRVARGRPQPAVSARGDHDILAAVGAPIGHRRRLPTGGQPRLPHHRAGALVDRAQVRSEEHTSELQSLMRISYDVFCLKTKMIQETNPICHTI